MVVYFQKTSDLEEEMYAKALVGNVCKSAKIFVIGSGENNLSFATLWCSICCDGFWHKDAIEAKK